MFFKKKGLPEESELVMCTVNKIHFNSVFVNLDEYDKQGMIHISEISPGRIRNIRDFIKEDKVIVCKVLRVNEERGHIDLSLRRVTDSQRRKKVNEIKQGQLAEKIVEFVAKELKQDKKDIFSVLKKKLLDDYETLYLAFQDVVEGGLSLDELGLDKNVTKKLEEVIRQRIKEQEVEIKGDLFLETYAKNGVEDVRNALDQAERKSENIQVTYGGGGKYRFIVKAKEYKEAEEIMKNSYEAAISKIEELGGTGKFVRAD